MKIHDVGLKFFDADARYEGRTDMTDLIDRLILRSSSYGPDAPRTYRRIHCAP